MFLNPLHGFRRSFVAIEGMVLDKKRTGHDKLNILDIRQTTLMDQKKMNIVYYRVMHIH